MWGDTPAAGGAPDFTQEFPSLGEAAKVKTQPSRQPSGGQGNRRGGGGGGSSYQAPGRHNNDVGELPRGPSGRSDNDGGYGSRDAAREQGRGGGGRDDYGSRDRDGGRDRDNRGGGGGYDSMPERYRDDREEPRVKHPVPDRAPFTAFVGNIPYDCAAEEIADWLGGQGIVEVRLKRKNAYVDFEDKASLEAALAMDGIEMAGRRIRMDVAEPPRSGSSSFGDRPRGHDREAYGGRGGDRDRDRGGGGDRDRDEEGPPRDFSMVRNRPMPVRSEAPARSERSGGYGGDRGGDRDRGDRGGFGRDRGGDRDGDRPNRDFGARREEARPQERKKFAIGKVMASTDKPATSSSSSSVFGEAKPIDGAEIQARLEAVRKGFVFHFSCVFFFFWIWEREKRG